MKKLFVGVLLFSTSIASYAVDGHNGITFKMTQKQVEAKGFVCSPETEQKYIIAVCNHMEMKGSAFGIPTENYEVKIGKNKRVEEISAELVGFSASIENYLDLTLKIQKFFPIKDEKLSFSGEGYFIKDFYRAKDKSGFSILMMKPIPPISKGSKTIKFISPYGMSEVDKKLANDAKQAESNNSAMTSADQEKPADTSSGN